MKKLMKKNFAFILLIIFCVKFSAQETIESISPVVDQKDSFNASIIKTFGEFLKNFDKKYWLESDFEKYQFPFADILGVQEGRLGKDFYKPSVMEIIPTDNPDKKILKVAFIGYNSEQKTNLIKSIYNVVASKVGNQIFFSRYLDYATKDWKIIPLKNITYRISPAKIFNENEGQRQIKDIETLTEFFGLKPFSIDFYSTVSPKETFEIKGFDYHTMMYADKSGGFAEGENLIISGNNSDYYTHEIVHLYTARLFPKIDPFFDEGIATYFGGSGKFDYQWQKVKLKQFLVKNSGFKFEEHLDPYERIYFENETPVIYVTSALICERIIRIYGKEKLFEIFNNSKTVSENLNSVGLGKANINKELRKELGLNSKSYL